MQHLISREDQANSRSSFSQSWVNDAEVISLIEVIEDMWPIWIKLMNLQSNLLRGSMDIRDDPMGFTTDPLHCVMSPYEGVMGQGLFEHELDLKSSYLEAHMQHTS